MLKVDAVLLDTSVWIAAFKGITRTIVDLTGNLLNDDRVLTCGPVLYEVRRGLQSHERKKIMPLMAAVNRLPFNEQDWDLAGDLDSSLRSRGITIPPIDLLIARICLSHHVSLFTLDKHFEYINGITLFKP